MTQPTLMFCVGATKAGTSWLYRYLHDHDECAMPSVKELHYFDSIDFGERAQQLEIWTSLRGSFALKREEMRAKGDWWRVENLQRQIDDISALEAMLCDPAGGEAPYRDMLFRDAAGKRLVGDMTPGYALLSEARLAQMAGFTPDVRFVYLMRDPVERLWSHVRMQAARKREPGQTVAEKARGILWRIVHRGDETHLTARGDYAGAVGRLSRAVPRERMLFEFTERLFTESGLRRLCAFLGLTYKAAEVREVVNAGPALEMDDEMRGWAARFLAPQYAFVKETFGTLPQGWRAGLAEV